MHRLQVLSLTAFMLMVSSRLPAQTPVEHDWDAQIVVCNDGKIGVDVVRAYRHPDYFSGDQWEVTGWYNVEPGKCEGIGRSESYATGGIFLKDPVTLLAFGFRDSTGVLGAIRFSPGTKNYYPTDQQFCVESEGFSYQASGSDPPRNCHGTQFLIPASYVFTGPLVSSRVGVANNELHVSISPNDRAIPMGKQASGSGTGAGADQSKGDATVGACGKVSCWDLFLQGLKQAGKDNEARRVANANGPGPSRPSINPPAPPSPAAPPAPPADDDDPFGPGGFITAPSNPGPAAAPAYSLQWVRTDMLAYIEASKTGFAAYKKGDVQVSPDYRMWDSSVKPAAARGCWVVQGTTATTLSCALSQRGDLERLRPYYADLNKEIAATLLGDWTKVERPFGGDLPNQGYRSSSGAHLEVWIAPADSAPLDEIHFQLVSAH
jgi:hypothetical protein